MRKKSRMCIILALFAAVSGFLVAQETGTGTGPEVLTKVTVQPVEIKETYNSIYYGARIEPYREYLQYPPLTGVIEEMKVRKGQWVAKGDILFSVRKDEINKTYRPLSVEARAAGVVTEIKALPGDPVSQGGWVVKIVATSPLKAIIKVSDQDIPLVKPGDVVRTSNSGGPVEGQVHRISLLPDYDTGLFDVELRFPSWKGLFIGEFVKVELRVNFYKGIVLQKKYVSQRYGKPHVWLFTPTESAETETASAEEGTASGKVVLQEVTTGPAYGDGVAVTGGIEEGDLVVTNASRMLQDGDEVVLEGK